MSTAPELQIEIVYPYGAALAATIVPIATCSARPARGDRRLVSVAMAALAVASASASPVSSARGPGFEEAGGVGQPVEQGAQAALIAAVRVERSEFLGAAGEDRVLVRRRGAEPRPDGCRDRRWKP